MQFSYLGLNGVTIYICEWTDIPRRNILILYVYAFIDIPSSYIINLYAIFL